MRDRHSAEHFERAISSLSTGSQESAEAQSDEILGRVQMAHRLMVLDLEEGSLARESVRRSLAREWTKRHARRSPDTTLAAWWVARRPLPVAVVVGVLAVVFLVAVVPASRGLLARPLFEILGMVRVGSHSFIVRTEVPTAPEAARMVEDRRRSLEQGRRWHLETMRYGSFSGVVPEGQPPTVRRVDSLGDLRAMTAFELQLPIGSHRGQIVSFSHAEVTPSGTVFVYLGSGSNELLLMETPLNDINYLVSVRMNARMGPDGQLVVESPKLKTEELTLDGRTIIWEPDDSGGRRDLASLRWEAGGMGYSLMGSSLTREEAVELFFSLRPLDK
jgi:hypothetical protein